MILPKLSGNTLSSEEKWFVLYTAPRAEKVVYKHLIEQQYKAYLPISRNVSIWKNRQKKIIEKPLFASYVFTKTLERELYNITKVPKVVTYLRNGSRPSTIAEHEIEQIRTMTTTGSPLTIEPTLIVGEKVRITEGPFLGYEGILQRRNGKSCFGIQLTDLNQTIFVELENCNLERLS